MNAVDQDLQTIRAMICDRFMIGFSVFGIPAAVVSILRASRQGWRVFITILLFVIAITALSTIFRKRIPYFVKAPFIVLLIALMGILGLLMYGLISAGIPFLIAAPLLAMLFLGWKISLVTLAFIVVTTTIVGLQILMTGRLPELDISMYLTSPEAWVNVIVTITAVVGALIYAFSGYANSLFTALTERHVAAEKALQAQKVALIALADLAEYRDIDSGGHVQRVARMSHEIAGVLFSKGCEPETCDENFLQHIGLASILHDVGKVTIPDAVLFKPGELTENEWAIMQKHAGNGAEILQKAMRMLPESMHFMFATQIARSHHEQWDGSGYPDGLKGKSIPLSARVVAVADVFDALISERSYKPAWSFHEALDYIRQRGGQQFDAAAVEAFMEVVDRREKVSVLAWSECLALGNPNIDHDHRILLQLLRQISSPGNQKDPISLKFMLDELTNYTHYHFLREERLMHEAGYPELKGHQLAHEQFRLKITAFQSSYEELKSKNCCSIASELETWLREHITGADRLFVSNL